MSENDRFELRDGQIVVYKRDGSPFYQMRLNIHGHRGYIVRSTKCKSAHDASVVASETYDDLRQKVRLGIEVKPHTFVSIWKRWNEAHRNVLSGHRIRYISGTANRYLLPYFGEFKAEELTNTRVEGYWTWRINFWSSDEGKTKIEAAQKVRATEKRPYKQKLGNVAKIPSQKTLQMEQTVLRQILRWANSNGLVARIPEIKAPKIAKGRGVARRPAFELHEWQTLYRYLRVWVQEPQKRGMTGKGPNSHHLWHRELIRSYVLFLGTSGLRPNEARKLRWMDIGKHEDDSGYEHVVLHIHPDTKTGERECIPLRTAKRYLERVHAKSKFTEPSDLVFCDKNGNPIDNFGKTFKSVLREIDLLEDRHGRERTIYSLRHTYATFKILYGNANIEDLAQNMGTSPTQIYQHYRHVTVRQKAKSLGGELNETMSRKGLYF